MSKCLVVQHVAPESPFAIEDALHAADVATDLRLVFDGAEIPDRCTGFDGLVVMGGPMSAASDDGFPTRAAEIALMVDALETGIPTLGICLGAQILATAAGSRVFAGASGTEVGWGPVDLEPACLDDPLFTGLPPSIEVLHWHGETFDLPLGGRRLVSNGAYRNQGFRIGAAGWGVQFHLEVTEAAVDGFVEAFPSEAAAAAGGAASILARTPGAVAELAPTRDIIVQRFARLVGAAAVRPDVANLV